MPGGYRLTPIGTQHHVAPMEQAAALSGREAAVQERDGRNISQRAAERLVVASTRHHAVLEQLRLDQERRREALEAQRSGAEALLAEGMAQVERDLEEANTGALMHLKDADNDDDRQQQSSRRHADARAEMDRNNDEATRSLLEAGDRADSAIAASKQRTAERLAALGGERAELAAKLQDDLRQRADAQARHLEEVALQGRQVMQKTAKYKITSSLTCNHIEELSQAGRTIAQQKAALTREKAAQHVSALTREAHEAQVHTDRAVKEHLEGSARQLIAAREHCEQVRAEMAQEAAAFAEQIRTLEEQHRGGRDTLDEQVRALEGSRVEAFRGSCRAAQDAEERFRGRRASCEAELDAVERRLLEIEEETQRRTELILAQWTDGNAAAEATVRRLEEQAEAALRDLGQAAGDGTKAAASQNGALQSSGFDAISELSRRGVQVQDETQPALELAREADERATLEAQRAAAALRPEPGHLTAEADAAAEAAQREAEDAQLALEAEGERAQALARAATRQARRQEQRLKAETAEAWARVRKACFQLRLAKLHDFSAGILDGTFDFPPASAKVAQ